MDMTIILTGIGSAATVIGFIYALLRNFKMDINEHLNRIEKRFDKWEARQDRHAARIDQLYQMFVDLLKEKK